MVQWKGGLPSKHEDLCLNPSHPCKKSGIAVYLIAQENRNGWILRPPFHPFELLQQASS